MPLPQATACPTPCLGRCHRRRGFAVRSFPIGNTGFVEIDRGTMSHARLRQKAELYAAYAASDAWRKRHQFLPALLFLTTTDIRAHKFMRALAGALSFGPRQQRRHASSPAPPGRGHHTGYLTSRLVTTGFRGRK